MDNLMLILITLLKAKQRRRNILINNLLNVHNEMLIKMENERRLVRQTLLVQANTSIPRMFFPIIRPRIRGIHKHKRNENFWLTLNEPGNEKMFFEAFRMRSETFYKLCEKLTPILNNSTTFVVAPLPIEKQVAVCLYKLASCAEYRVIGDVFGIHKSTVHKYFHKVINAIVERRKEFIKFPSLVEAQEVAKKFEDICHIPNIIGAIDGTHIPILPPAIGHSDYINQKGWPSIVMQGVVDHTYKFIEVYVRHPGSSDDALVFKESGLYKNSAQIIPKYSKLIDDVSTPLFLIGDPAYPLLPWLMRPYIGRLTPEKESFNCHLSSARMAIENAFGRLKGRWRAMSKRIDVDPSFVPCVVLACTVLHNFVEESKENFLDAWNAELAEYEREYSQPSSQVSTSITLENNNVDSKIIRNNLSNYLKNNFPLRTSHLH